MKRGLWVTLLLTLFPLLLFAQTEENAKDKEALLNRLFAPGPLIMGHSDLEKKDCLKCHDAGKGVPDEKCLDCHKEIRPYVEKKQGYHGLVTKSCRECHADHKGRDHDSAVVDPKSFDHGLTGYKLEGKHAEIKCQECHQEKRSKKPIRPNETRYLGAATSCRDCHIKEDVHFYTGKWKKADCGECHGLMAWDKDIRFDHLRDGDYKLEGAHAKADCKDCHIVDKKKKLSRYKWPNLKTKVCLSCHEDTHKNNLSPKFRNGKCTSCHGQEEWKIKKFDHQAVAKFPLRGRHNEINCTNCHVQAPKTNMKKTGQFKYTGLGEKCLDCHKDFHFFGAHKSKKLGNLNACEACHFEDKWTEIHDFNHNRNTRYPVDGEHLELDCLQCHVSSLREKGQKALDLKETLKPQFWLKPSARGKLLKSQYHWQHLDSKTCENCHESPHKKEFSAKLLKKKCTDCHVTTGWKDRPRDGDFDHEVTRFKLTGEHTKLKCAQCHVVNKKQIFKFPSKELQFCVDCHKDPHKDQLGPELRKQSCANCHDTKTFTKIKQFDHKETNFDLKGKHKKVKCNDCHKQTKERFPFKPNHRMRQYLFPDLERKDCAQCHKDFHLGQLKEKKCSQCHNENNWKKVDFDHNEDSRFKLKGAHGDLKCSECHRPTKKIMRFKKKKRRVVRFKPMDTECIACHAKDDKHKGEMGKKCESCHREDDWTIVKDFHRNYTLHGVHYTLQCAECHGVEGRKLSGLSDQCLLCHQKDDVHNSTLPYCGECHRQSFWEDSQFRHSLSSFPLRGVHRTLDCVNCHTSGVYQGTPNTCFICHQSDAASVSSPPHIMPNFMECSQCHNQFTFTGAN
ncbi:MAG: hypothetical protein H6624_08200 [Bdellovibrionaceae bacterium]|nr:hypothetical protein [Bdellovibrionales bacterium]MCB9084313.1 hypothetical protein [Pseudobdellovibrionaceae bacterium]